MNTKTKVGLSQEELNKWVTALRSGNYTKMEKGLFGLCSIINDVANYSCLGVLIEELFGDSIWVVLENETTHNYEVLDHRMPIDGRNWIPTKLLPGSIQDALQLGEEYMYQSQDTLATWIEDNLLPGK